MKVNLGFIKKLKPIQYNYDPDSYALIFNIPELMRDKNSENKKGKIKYTK